MMILSSESIFQPIPNIWDKTAEADVGSSVQHIQYKGIVITSCTLKTTHSLTKLIYSLCNEDRGLFFRGKLSLERLWILAVRA